MLRWTLRIFAGLVVFIGGIFAFFPAQELFESWRVQNAALADAPWMAVIGDSSVTGAAAHPDLSATWPSLGGAAWDLLTKERRLQKLAPNLADYIAPAHYGIHTARPPTRLFYSTVEAQEKPTLLLNLKAKAQLKLDTEEYSFGYLVGRRLNIEPARILIAGEDGAMLNTLSAQFQRILDAGVRTLPPLMLISFVANEMCDPADFAKPTADFIVRYRQSLRDQLAKVARFPAHKNGTRLVWLAPLDLANILSNPQLMAQQVRLDVGLTTCGQMRASSNGGWFAWPIRKILINECPAVLDPSRPLPERLKRVQELQKAQIAVLGEEFETFNKSAPAGLKLELALSVRDTVFQTGDLAADCFHPSVGGHTRIANRLLANELRLPVSFSDL